MLGARTRGEHAQDGGHAGAAVGFVFEPGRLAKGLAKILLRQSGNPLFALPRSVEALHGEDLAVSESGDFAVGGLQAEGLQ